MILYEYANIILSRLFNVEITEGESATDEKTRLLNEIKEKYSNITAFPDNIHTYNWRDNDTKREQDMECIDMINKSKNWVYKSTPCLEPDHSWEEVKDKTGATIKEKFTCQSWKLEEKSNAEKVRYYPSKSYIGLFTAMPSADGTGFAEPTSSDYMRVDLHKGIITGTSALNNATINADNGTAQLTNKELIIFPEAYEASWGKIIGFGIFDTQTVGVGTPYFWGRLSTYVDAAKEHVPLLRPGDFEITIG